MIITILFILVVLIAALLVFAATRPDIFRIQRTTIQTPPEKIFPLISDFRQWNAWSPYEKMDPAMKRAYGGVASGKGAMYAWEGDKKVGQGRMEIKEVSVPSKVVIAIDFFKPMQAHNTIEFTLAAEDNSTAVPWAMHGANPYLAKVMGIFFNMDRMIGKDFETGLGNLKAMVEK